MSDIPTKLISQEWDEIIEKYKSSELSVVKWCEIHGFKPHQLRWCNRQVVLNSFC